MEVCEALVSALSPRIPLMSQVGQQSVLGCFAPCLLEIAMLCPARLVLLAVTCLACSWAGYADSLLGSLLLSRLYKCVLLSIRTLQLVVECFPKVSPAGPVEGLLHDVENSISAKGTALKALLHPPHRTPSPPQTMSPSTNVGTDPLLFCRILSATQHYLISSMRRL